MEGAKYAMNIKEEKGRQNQMIENRLKAERPRLVTEKATKGKRDDKAAKDSSSRQEKNKASNTGRWDESRIRGRNHRIRKKGLKRSKEQAEKETGAMTARNRSTIQAGTELLAGTPIYRAGKE